ncbi:MAG: MerR family transcriptional regulator [Alphaproteobacteria bacterium]|nr:MerR family transcriptional regulator [Alphaproteobacteria bacterium]
MAEWYVKELSKLTKVSVKTLYHYDKIGLLKPSVRLPNNYRLYSEADLLKLQQILALKFFGFELARIKALMEEEINIFDHFRAQQKFLAQKVQSLQEASQTLAAILSESGAHKSVPWKTILKLIEDYQMTKELDQAWAAKALMPHELNEYIHFMQGLTTLEKEAFEQKWANMVKEVNAHLDKEPTSNFGVDVGKRCMELVDGIYGKNHAALRTTVWEKGFKGGHSDVPPAVITWIDKAISEYHRRHIYAILDQVETHTSDGLLRKWEDLLAEIYGNDQDHKDALYEEALADEKVRPAAKAWLKQQRK